MPIVPGGHACGGGGAVVGGAVVCPPPWMLGPLDPVGIFTQFGGVPVVPCGHGRGVGCVS